jgi:lipopolysaccharide assembly outer membrane protein LptD (OstA)
MQTSLFKKMMDPHYYTATVDSNSMSGQVSHQVIRSSSLRQAMRAASRFNAVQPIEALISVFRHTNGHDPKLVAKRLVADRFWKYAEKYQ